MGVRGRPARGHHPRAQPVSRGGASGEAGGGGGGGGGGADAPPQRRTFQPGARVYVGRLPMEATWRELSELFAGFGELVHVQLPCDEAGRRRGHGVVELGSAEAAAAACDKLELAELMGAQLVVRRDERVVNERGGARLFVGNLHPTVTELMLRQHIKIADPTGAAHVKLAVDERGASMGYGFIEFRNAAAADAAVWTLHNSNLAGMLLFARQDCDMSDLDGAEAQARREAAGKNMQMLHVLSSWVEAAPPLVEWGWCERGAAASPWAPRADDDAAAAAGGRAVGAAARAPLAWIQLLARLKRVVYERMDASQLQGIFERYFGEKIDIKALGFSSLRETLAAVPTLHLETLGARLYVSPADGGRDGGPRGGGGAAAAAEAAPARAARAAAASRLEPRPRARHARARPRRAAARGRAAARPRRPRRADGARARSQPAAARPEGPRPQGPRPEGPRPARSGSALKSLHCGRSSCARARVGVLVGHLLFHLDCVE